MKKKMWIPSIYGDGAILQRGVENIIYGRDESAEVVTAVIDKGEYSAMVENGSFALRIPAHEAGTGFTLEIRGSATKTFYDICFGDVFMLSGQSNMQLPVSRVLDVSKEEVEDICLPLIRHFTVEPNYSFGEAGELTDAKWTRATDGEFMTMSAAGFFFAKKLYEQINVPIGLVLNAQGGATVEAWMSEQLLKSFGDYTAQYEDFLEKGSIYRFMRDCDKAAAVWNESVASGKEQLLCCAVPDGTETITLPNMTMGTALDGFSGSVWFYKEFELEKTDGEAFLYVGELVDSDRTYINGELVGETFYRYPPRKYPFDRKVLQKGRNLIAIRLVIEHGAGGFIPEHEYYIIAGESKISLEGEWKYYIEKRAETTCKQCLISCNTTAKEGSVWLQPNDGEGFLSQHVPTGLYYGSLLPLKGVGFKAVLWYQGESNAGEPDRYAEKFDAMINEWRRALSQRLPIIVVELADYVEPTAVNYDSSGWASIQEQQRNAPRVTKDCAVVSAKDLGEPFELHPQKKSALGLRLAEKALELWY